MASYTLRLCIGGYVALCDEVLREAAAGFPELEALHDKFPLAGGDAERLSFALDQAEFETMMAARKIKKYTCIWYVHSMYVKTLQL